MHFHAYTEINKTFSVAFKLKKENDMHIFFHVYTVILSNSEILIKKYELWDTHNTVG